MHAKGWQREIIRINQSKVFAKRLKMICGCFKFVNFRRT